MKTSKIATLPTVHGKFKMFCVLDEKNTEHAVLFKGNLEQQENVLLRVHSECLTGDVFHSLKCDCGEQLNIALALFAKENAAILIYLRQEGRGIGLFNKINAYNLQDKGLDTVEANLELGLEKDNRDYKLVAEILSYLKLKSVILLTNNPDKITKISEYGVVISDRKPLITIPNNYNKSYLNIKKIKMNHLI